MQWIHCWGSSWLFHVHIPFNVLHSVLNRLQLQEMDYIVIQMYSFRTMLGTLTTVACPTKSHKDHPRCETADWQNPRPSWTSASGLGSRPRQQTTDTVGSQSHSPNRKYIGHGNTMDLIRVRIRWTECSTVDPIILKQGYGGFEGLSLNILNLMLRWSISWIHARFDIFGFWTCSFGCIIITDSQGLKRIPLRG